MLVAGDEVRANVGLPHLLSAAPFGPIAFEWLCEKPSCFIASKPTRFRHIHDPTQAMQ